MRIIAPRPPDTPARPRINRAEWSVLNSTQVVAPALPRWAGLPTMKVRVEFV